jgi:thiol-disulfide isomerase/thioredoxin
MRSAVRFILPIALAIATGVGTTAQTPKLVYPQNDPAKDIAAALTAAKKDGKHVLIDFGADWCPDCRVLGALFETEVVAPVADANFHIVHVDVGRRDKNLDLVERYKATAGDWIPAVVVLDSNASTIGLTNDDVRLTRRTTPEQLRDLLQQWGPKQKLQELATFTERGVRVQLTLERDSAGRSWLAGAFTPLDAETHLYAQEMPADGVDGVGRPTRVHIVGGNLKATGPAVANRPVQSDTIELLKQTYPIYPPGAVTVRVPVARVKGDTSSRTEVSITYMGCGPKGCLPPVIDKRVIVELGTLGALEM